jgi:CRP/FNR family transcriptional regulator, anaerobic regulatory protein
VGAVCAVKLSTTGLPRSTCPNCGFAAWSQSAHLTSDELKQIDEQVVHFRPIRRHEYVHRSGAPLTSLNIIHSGFLKTSITNCHGNLQVTGFSMRGDMVGMDGISTGVHQCDTIALEDTYLCGIDFARLERITDDIPALRRLFQQTIGVEIARQYGVMFLLGAMRADERVAIFLLNLSKRFAARGCSAVDLRLPMQRREIADYLGLKLETVSRILSRLQECEVIAIDGKNIEIKSVERLHQITGR